MQQIALLNPMVGHYEYFDDKDSAKQRFSELMLEFFLSHTHQEPFSMVEIDEDGIQTWKSINFTDITDI
jgi:hypothetical protein